MKKQLALSVAGLLIAGVVLAQPGGGPLPGLLGADNDGDGMISREEAQAAVDRHFERLDANADGLISCEEIVDGRHARREDRRDRFSDRAATRFASLDTDGDGAVSLAEWQATNPNLTQERFARIDTDGNGLVDISELSERRGRSSPGRPGGDGGSMPRFCQPD